MDLLWVRHGEPERIAPGRGVPANPALTERGRDQAERLSAWLAPEIIDLVLTSPQRRAIETAEPIARVHGLEPVVVPGLVGVRRPIRQLHPDGRAQGLERSAPRGDVRRSLGGVRRRTGRDVPGAGHRDHRRDRRGQPRTTGRGGLPRRRHQRRVRDRTRSRAPPLVRAALHVVVADDRVTHGCAVRRVPERTCAP